MTNALELFCSRRARLGRASADLELGSAPDTSHRRRHLERRSGGYSIQSSRRQGFDGCIPTPRSSLVPGYGTSFMDGVPFELNSGTNEHIPTTNSLAAEEESGSSNISRVTCSERLPSAVLQARERLLQRLRGAAVSDRRSRRSASNVSRSSDIFSDDIRLVDAGDWETDIFRGGNNSSASSIFHSEQYKKPLALCPEALNSLPIEIFSVSNETADDTADDKLVVWDCSICLERFSDGNELVGLPCSHRFHHACLVQWGQVRGDCPCCRRSIT